MSELSIIYMNRVNYFGLMFLIRIIKYICRDGMLLIKEYFKNIIVEDYILDEGYDYEFWKE